MNDLLEFLTSQEIIIVYIIAALACLICFIVYLVEKNNEKLRLRHNTRELNKLVEEIKSITPESKQEVYETPILETIEPTEKQMVIGPINVEETVDLSEVVEEVKKYEDEVLEEEPEEELEYTTIEPDQETARLELKKLQEQLEKEELREQMEEVQEVKQEQAQIVEPVQEEKIETIDPVNQYEEEQEKTAIISLEELLAKSKEMYEANELTQYKDEGNEPISIQDLELQVQKQAASYDEPFIIANVVPEEELQEGINEAFDSIVAEEKEVLKMDDMNTIKEETVNPIVKEEVKKFQASPIISPIFGIEKDTSRDSALSLENTANYEKLDAAIRKNNEFYMSISELQGKTD